MGFVGFLYLRRELEAVVGGVKGDLWELERNGRYIVRETSYGPFSVRGVFRHHQRTSTYLSYLLALCTGLKVTGRLLLD